MSKPAARLSDQNACPLPGHGVNPAVTGSPNVIIDGLAALRVGDSTACGDVVTEGIATILVNGQPIAFLGSATAHGGVIITGSGDVLVGTQHTPAPFTPPAPLPNSFQDKFQLVCSQTGEPLPNYPYAIRRANGAMEKGISDDQGFTHMVSCMGEAEKVQILVGGGA
ncbi:putative Zn-binding protein involved in type VI secretion [Pseudomonas nitritireducens]|uniref:Putative Zn-binding protein involved in type VI secretion n=1 Tax=Pseudomonas nitroreducens TaxID=46680 RepID=A0A7W7P4S1_PSENT|nr:PAAR domain-containing protein [Pseudomonas nitritireducens]MBB4866542.1 putative Zn-binding protein involved in type VI secretion [Pseudomonas nitritireducens]